MFPNVSLFNRDLPQWDTSTVTNTVPVVLNNSELTVEKNDFIDKFATTFKEQENLCQQLATNNEEIFRLQTLLINNQQKLINKQKKVINHLLNKSNNHEQSNLSTAETTDEYDMLLDLNNPEIKAQINATNLPTPVTTSKPNTIN